MASILNDIEIRRLIGTVIQKGDESNIRPNSYILCLGEHGEFINSGKEFKLGTSKKGIKVQPGNSVALTAYETLDFRRETVRNLFPDCDLHGLVSPNTDLSREGIVASTTQIDAGYYGTLNWTITNTSSEERRFLYQERLFRLVIFKLEKDENPQKLYDGDYQAQIGYVRSQRKGAPTGMRENEWEDSITKDSPEVLLDNLLKSGYPWNTLGQRLKMIDQQLKTVSDEYAVISASIENLSTTISSLNSKNSEIIGKLPQTIREILKDETSYLQNRWLIGIGSIFVVLFGLILSISSNNTVLDFFKKNGALIGCLLIIIGLSTILIISRFWSRKK